MPSEYWEQPTLAAEADVIQGWCFSEDHSPPPPIRVLPDGDVSVLFSAPADGKAWQATVLGATTRASIVHHPEPRVQIQARLAPGAACALLGARPWQLRDRAVPLRELWGRRASQLLGELEEATSWPDRRTTIEQALGRGRATIDPTAELVRRAACVIRRHQGRVLISALCAALGAHPRQLERAFAHHVGITPKLLARIVRFRSAREALRRRTPAVQIAVAAGYSDQAHMTREFRAFAGVPPSLLGSAVAFVQAVE